MWTPEILLLVAAAFLAGGLVKGLIGTGLPTVGLALLAATLGLKVAMPLIVVPALVTNVWQALSGGAFLALLRRLWPLLAMLCIGAWFGAGVLARGDALVFSGLLGVLLCLYAAISLLTPQIPAPGRWERLMSPAVGGVTGVITGLTGTFIVPGVLYIQALGLPRDHFVQAMGITFTVASLALAIALGGHGLLPVELGLMSLAGLPTALLGQALGRWLRGRFSEAGFRRVFFAGLAVIGVYLALRAFL
ncbi:MAG: sulfite exporter TauE/SafE family protein [Kiloniellales bacterium]|nr:sulfite exporter TauE/SafE family protein [Kiloniellales bacterium]